MLGAERSEEQERLHQLDNLLNSKMGSARLAMLPNVLPPTLKNFAFSFSKR